jgi:hypothetical protein
VAEQPTSNHEFSINVLNRSSGWPGQSDCVFGFPQAFDVGSRDDSAIAHNSHVLFQKITCIQINPFQIYHEVTHIRSTNLVQNKR